MQQAHALQGLPTSRPATMVGEYIIVAELARGGMGCVYLARRKGQAGFERHFAVKVMNHNLAGDHDAMLMLLDEAHIASRLHHPNVVSVLDIGMADGGYYLVMDYVEGCSLQELIQRNRESRPARRIVPILLEALHGLHAVHTLRNVEGELYGVVHRDVSPHNLLVGLDGGCRVTDFGIAKASERFSDTQAGVYKGKLAYMAPEQLKGSGEIDRRADVWSAGVTLYVALTGKHPFRGPNDAATLHAILTAEIPPPSEVGLKPPACLDEVVLRALARDRDARFESAQAFGDALRRVALEHDLLGSPSEVAAWVEETFGKELTERRRRILSVVTTDPAEPMTSSGPVPVVPRLWGSPDQEATRASSRDALLAAEAAAEADTARRKKRALTIAIVTGVALGSLALALDRRGANETAPEAARVEAPKEAATVTETREAPVTASAAASPPGSERAAEAESQETAPSEMRGSAYRRSRARALTPTSTEGPTEPRPASAPPAPVAAAPREAPAAAPTPTPAPAPRRELERNPYLSGE